MNVQHFFEAIAKIFADRENVKINVTVRKKEEEK